MTDRPPLSSELMNDGSRHFASMPRRAGSFRMRRHLSKLDGAEETDFITDRAFDWWLDFMYEGHEFTLNEQLGNYWFIVSDPQCPDEILMAVVQHFEKLLGSK